MMYRLISQSVILLCLLVVCAQVYAQSDNKGNAHHTPPTYEQNANKDKRGGSAPPIAITITNPPVDKAASKDAQEREEDTANAKAMTFLTGLLVGIGIVQALIFLLQLRVFLKQEKWMRQTVVEMTAASKDTKRSIQIAKEANDLTRKSLESNNRAYVFLEKLEIVEARHGKTDCIIKPKWKNYGNTPTRNMRSCISWEEFPSDVGYQFIFPDIARDIARNIGTTEIGPPGAHAKASTIGPGASIDGETLMIPMHLIKSRRLIYVWGWIEYNDVFSSDISKKHRTEFCYRLAFICSENDVNTILQGTYDFSNCIEFQLHRKHNGSDDECVGGQPYAE